MSGGLLHPFVEARIKVFNADFTQKWRVIEDHINNCIAVGPGGPWTGDQQDCLGPRHDQLLIESLTSKDSYSKVIGPKDHIT